MRNESHFSKPANSELETSLNEIAYVWPQELRNQRYKELVGQFPETTLSDEEIAKGILYPEEEREAVRRRNLEDDKGETIKTYRR